MPVVKIGQEHQVTIPSDIFDKLHLKSGDLLEAIEQEGKIVMVPQSAIAKTAIISLTSDEQQVLFRAKKKIEAIQNDLANSQGLTDDEIKVAIKVHLIESDQAWWWKEEWQKKERETEKEIFQREISGPFNNMDELLEHISKK